MKYYYFKTAGKVSKGTFEILALIEIEKEYVPFIENPFTKESDGISVVPKKFIINKENRGIYNETLNILEENYCDQGKVVTRIFNDGVE